MKTGFVLNILGMMFMFLGATALLVIVIMFCQNNFGVFISTLLCICFYVASYQFLKDAYKVAREHSLTEKEIFG